MCSQFLGRLSFCVDYWASYGRLSRRLVSQMVVRLLWLVASHFSRLGSIVCKLVNSFACGVLCCCACKVCGVAGGIYRGVVCITVRMHILSVSPVCKMCGRFVACSVQHVERVLLEQINVTYYERRAACRAACMT